MLVATEASMDGYPEAPIFSPEYKAHPYPYYREWTSKGPFWAMVDSRRAVIVARFHDVEAVYRDHQRFSSVKPSEPGMERFDFFNGLQDMVHTDPPDHTRLRACVSHAFMPRSIAKLDQRIEALAEELLEAAAGGNHGFEAMSQFARPLSVNTLLGVLLEVKPQDFPVFEDLTRGMALLSDVPPGGKPPQAYLDVWARGRAYCERLIELRRRQPSDDLVGQVVQAQISGNLSLDELYVMLIGLFIGGLSTIATQIGNALIQLVSRPEQYRLLCADPSLVPGAVEESLRYDSAGLFNYKFAAQDCVLGELDIPKGTAIFIIHQAAGFDPTVFEDPFRFDILRKAQRHLAFGYGIHACIGAPIARAVLRSALTSCVRHFPRLRLASSEPIRYGGWLQERAPESVSLAFN